MGGLLDEASLELFESQSHLLDADSRAALAKQRQLLQWQAGGGLGGGSSLGEEGALAAAATLERQDSAGSGNEPLDVRWASVRSCVNVCGGGGAVGGVACKWWRMQDVR